MGIEVIMETKINYKSDFDFILRLKDCNDNELGWPTEDWQAKFWTSTKANSFVASCIDGECENCFNDNGQIHIVLDNHGLGVGELKCEFEILTPAENYKDGSRKTVSVVPTDIELVKEDCSCSNSISADVSLPVVSGSQSKPKAKKKANSNQPIFVYTHKHPSVADSGNRNYYLVKIYDVNEHDECSFPVRCKALNKFLHSHNTSIYIKCKGVYKIWGIGLRSERLSEELKTTIDEDGILIEKKKSYYDRYEIGKIYNLSLWCKSKRTTNPEVISNGRYAIIHYDDKKGWIAKNPGIVDYKLIDRPKPTIIQIRDFITPILGDDEVTVYGYKVRFTDRIQIQLRRSFVRTGKEQRTKRIKYWSNVINNKLGTIYKNGRCGTSSRIFRARWCKKLNNGKRIGKSQWTYFFMKPVKNVRLGIKDHSLYIYEIT